MSKHRAMVWADLFGPCSEAWVRDCYRWRGEPLLGKYGHWCGDWDVLPVDETTPEWSACTCYDGKENET